MDTLPGQDKLSSQEKFFFYNTLSVLIKTVVGHRTTIDLRNESMVYGLVEHADAFMNVTMRDCYFTDPRGNTHKYDMFFVRTRNIRSVHIPPQIRMIPAMTRELKKLYKGHNTFEQKFTTFRGKRTQEKHRKDLLMAQELVQKKKEDMQSPSSP